MRRGELREEGASHEPARLESVRDRVRRHVLPGIGRRRRQHDWVSEEQGPDSGAKILALKTALKLALDTILIL